MKKDFWAVCMAYRLVVVIPEIFMNLQMTLFFEVHPLRPTSTTGVLQFLDEVSSGCYEVPSTEIWVDYPLPHPVPLRLFVGFYGIGKLLNRPFYDHFRMNIKIVIPVYKGPDNVMWLSIVWIEDADNGIGVLV